MKKEACEMVTVKRWKGIYPKNKKESLYISEIEAL